MTRFLFLTGVVCWGVGMVTVLVALGRGDMLLAVVSAMLVWTAGALTILNRPR